ncbi:MAG: penicillin-binding protein 2 [Alphaproteobacteria bacterium]
MNRDGDRGKVLTRRATILAGGKLFLCSTLAARMYYLQVIKSEEYKMQADANRIQPRILPPQRGIIYDRLGNPIATNKQNFRALIISEQTDNVNATLNKLSHIINLSDYDYTRIKREIAKKRAFVPVSIRENLSWEDMAKIQVNAPDLPGVIIDEGLSRHYIYNQTMAHAVGYVAAVNETELGRSSDPLLELPGFRIGKSGVEKVYDLSLRGKRGSLTVEVNAVGRVIKEIERKEGEAGEPLFMTIDAQLQQFAFNALKDAAGAAVVIDVKNGDVLAMASTPSFDPNILNLGIANKEWNALLRDPKNPLVNKAIAGQYSPGSTFKMIVALAGLEAGVINPEFAVFCKGYMELGNHRFHCWKKEGHGLVTLREALKQSCDIYFYEVAKRTGIDRIAEMSKKFGLGQVSGIDLTGEVAGLIPDRAWKQSNFREPWQQGESLVAGIGQGYILTTPIQLAVMIARMVNGGYAIKPRMTYDWFSGKSKNQEHSPAKINVSREHLELIKWGMYDVVNAPHGTALGSRFNLNGAKMAGKTGTTQVRRISMRERETGVLKQEDLPWKERNHALFVGFAPFDNPQYAVSVIIEHGMSGSAAAAPIASAILKEAIRLNVANKDITYDEALGKI